MAHCVYKWAGGEVGGRRAWLHLLLLVCIIAYFFRFDTARNKKSMYPMSAAPWKTKLMRGTRTCCALRRCLAFPPYVLIVDIDILVVVLFPILVVFVVFVAIAIVLHRQGWANSFLPRRRRRRRKRCGRHPLCCVTDGCAWMTNAVGAEPLAVWDGCQGRREARVMIWFIALRAAEMSTGDERWGGR
jgi:hypothetical protein